jgi:hypothetical protein
LQRLGGGLDVEIEIAPGAPPERLKTAVLAAVGQKTVVDAQGGAVTHGVAVSLVLVFVVEGFGVGEADFCALAAGDGEQRIGGGEGLAVEEDMDVDAGGQGRGFAGKRS